MINSAKNYNDSKDNSEIKENKITNKTVDLTLNSIIYSFNVDKTQFLNHFNNEKLIIDNNEWLSEKPISILQLDSADRAVLKIAGIQIFYF